MSWSEATGNRGSQNLCFSSRPFVLCGLPVRPLPEGQLLYERRNGNFVLQITGHPEFGVPFGQDRIVPIFLATLAVRQKSQTIRFRSAAEMLETFGMQKGGKEYRRLVAAFERIFGATMFFGTDTMTPKGQRSFSDPDSTSCGRPRSGTPGYIGPGAVVRIRERDRPERRVLQGDRSHPVPTDLEAVRC